MNFFRVFKGEMIKQTKNYYNSWQTYISLLFWPILNAISTYYVYQTFNLELLSKLGIDSRENLLIFIFSGTMGYNCFWAMVQSARHIRNERENGTIEMIFLTPANRMAFVYGRAMGGIAQNVWMFVTFTVLIFFLYEKMSVLKVFFCVVAFFIILVSSVIWGGFINSLFLISRDVDFWFTLFDSPMELLSGVRIPINVFPMFIRVASCIFPLTFCLIIVREIFILNCISIENINKLCIVLTILVISTAILLRIAEKRNRITGGFVMY